MASSRALVSLKEASGNTGQPSPPDRQKTLADLLPNKKPDNIIPDYVRPPCQTPRLMKTSLHHRLQNLPDYPHQVKSTTTPTSNPSQHPKKPWKRSIPRTFPRLFQFGKTDNDPADG